jgi:KEOPS complex subunit Cgi121
LTDAFGIRAATFRVSGCAGFLGELRAIGAARGTRIICFNADLMAGRPHAVAAILRALRAVEAGAAISASLEMEALLYASGNRQCSVAERFGIHEGENRAWICLVPPVQAAFGDLARIMEFVADDGDWELLPMAKQGRLMEAFGITPGELAAAGGTGRLRDLVLERVALLEVYR